MPIAMPSKILQFVFDEQLCACHTRAEVKLVLLYDNVLWPRTITRFKESCNKSALRIIKLTATGQAAIIVGMLATCLRKRSNATFWNIKASRVSRSFDDSGRGGYEEDFWRFWLFLVTSWSRFSCYFICIQLSTSKQFSSKVRETRQVVCRFHPPRTRCDFSLVSLKIR